MTVAAAEGNLSLVGTAMALLTAGIGGCSYDDES
jgi:hypothetical protein